MTSIDEKIKNAKKQALTEWLQGEYWHDITYQKYEDHYLKSLMEQKAREEKNAAIQEITQSLKEAC